jgi:hypothetical protein
VVHRKLILGALGALLAALTGVAATFAFVGDQAAGGENVVRAADLVLGGTADGAALLADDLTMRPGQAAREGTTLLRNDSPVPGDLYARLSVVDGASAALIAALRVQLLRCRDDGCTIFDRVAPAASDQGDWIPLSALRTRIALGTLEPGAAVRYRTRLLWPAAQDDPALYGTSIGEVALRWSLRTPSPGDDR